MIVLEIYEEFMGLMFLTDYHKIAFDSLHRIMLSFTDAWGKKSVGKVDSTQSLTRHQFQEIIEVANVEFPHYEEKH
ncbi:hypothetical protein [Candidatus Lokiarchaeum ossiferum]|uniref:hypothetical protein n=1 Tax=Candidatus Lokiarchaeum ossiferum TaxID=2951803 RepID=UPI00352C91EA